MRKLLFLLLLTPLFVQAQQKGEKLDQIPIAIYDKMRAFEENKYLDFLAEIPTEVYQDGNTYYWKNKARDYDVSYDGYFFIATKKHDDGRVSTYRLVVKNKKVLGTNETTYPDGNYYLELLYKKGAKWWGELDD